MFKKGYSTGFALVYSLIAIFVLGLLYVIFNQVFLVEFTPVIKSMVNGTTGQFDILPTTQVDINNGIDKYLSFWSMIPFIIFFVVILYMIMSGIRNEQHD